MIKYNTNKTSAYKQIKELVVALIAVIILAIMMVDAVKAEAVIFHFEDGKHITLQLESNERLDDYIIMYDDAENNTHIYFTNEFFNLLANSESKEVRDLVATFKAKYQFSLIPE